MTLEIKFKIHDYFNQILYDKLIVIKEICYKFGEKWIMTKINKKWKNVSRARIRHLNKNNFRSCHKFNVRWIE